MKPSRLLARVKPQDETVGTVETETDPVGDFEVAKAEIVPTRRDFAGIDEQGRVERPPGFPAVLGGEQQAVAVPKTKLPKPAQRLFAPESWLVVERHLVPSVRVGDHSTGPQRKQPDVSGRWADTAGGPPQPAGRRRRRDLGPGNLRSAPDRSLRREGRTGCHDRQNRSTRRCAESRAAFGTREAWSGRKALPWTGTDCRCQTRCSGRGTRRSLLHEVSPLESTRRRRRPPWTPTRKLVRFCSWV